jgi:hypothetical protein
MNGAIYAADVWCADCAESIKERIRAEGHGPDDEDDQTSYDSDEFPKDCDVSCESDIPEHCAAGTDCINAYEFIDGDKIGCWLENDLTTHGEDYVKDAVRVGGDVAELWADWYDYIDFSVTKECPDCNEEFDPDDLDEDGLCLTCAGYTEVDTYIG